MKYYIEKKIKSFNELSEIVIKSHVSGLCLGWYFNLNKVRFFSDSKTDLYFLDSDVRPAPDCKSFIKCQRIRSIERQSDTQRKKRMERLKKHLEKKGVEFKESRTEKKEKYDYFINMNSLSNSGRFKLFIKQTISKEETKGTFSSYGFSKNNSNLPYWG